MLKQSLQQKLLQKLSPQQIQLMKLLQVPTVALEQRIKEELESNPALDEGVDNDRDNDQEDYQDDYNEENKREDFDLSEYISDDEVPSYKTSIRNAGPDEEEKSLPLSMGKSFHEILTAQLGLLKLSEEEKVISEHLIGNLDDAGYLRRDITSIIDDLAFYQNIEATEQELERLLIYIQEMEPAGSGARDLQECLLIQIKRKNRSDLNVYLAEKIIEKTFEEFSKKHYQKIIKKFDVTEEELRLALEEILKLNPKPGGSMNETQRVSQAVVPDFHLTIEDGKLNLQLNGRNAPELKVSREYKNLLKGYQAQKKEATKSQKEAVLFVKQKLDSAKWFIEAIKQRQNTLLNTMQTIIDLQYDYFMTGDETKIKPMILKDIADKIDMDISTVSRVSNSKYIQTPYGTFLLKTFFSERMQNSEGEDVSTREIKRILQDTIGVEDKKRPLTDEKLAQLLKEKGYPIARRTVAKYREQLSIPVGRLRREI
ncbi:MAG: RNA polymerase sigma-54 factor [Flavobacteriales bacterium]|nr:RNA polymerase sigma-54 factor [Flavobacteriales bacterium]